MKVVTFNIRMDNPEDGKNAFPYRRPLIQKIIEERKPDIIGFQEALPHMADWLKECLCDYYIVGHGREKDLSGEHVLIAYKKTAYNLHYTKTFWLSATPSVPGSRYRGQSICPRTCICAVFEDKNHGLFQVWNTHLDHTGKFARRSALEQIMRTVHAEGKKVLPFILMGDFNTLPGQEELQPLFAAEFASSGLRDVTAASGGTFHNYGKTQNEKIDYIFASAAFSTQGCALWNDCEDGLYLSDHYPLEAELSLNRE